MIKIFIGLIILAFSLNGFSQDYNSEKTSLTNFLKRMYNSSPYTGVKVVEDYENNYLISVVILDKKKYTSSSLINRVAQVKAQSQASTFLNGSNIEMDFIMKTTEKRSEESENVTIETVEKIKENSSGFVKALELLSNFDSEQEEGMMVFIYFKTIE